jgi:hypothetical protein
LGTTKCLSSRTIASYLSGVAKTHKLYGHVSPTLHKNIQVMLRTLKLQQARSGKAQVRSLAMSSELLTAVCDQLRSSNKPADRLIHAALLVGVFGMLRISELTSDEEHNQLRIKHAKFSDDGLDLLIPLSKADQEGKGAIVTITNESAVTALRQYLAKRKATPTSPLFAHADGSQLKSKDFLARIKQLILTVPPEVRSLAPFRSVSLRATGATLLAAEGVDLQQIMTNGRWTSTAVDRYIRADAVRREARQQSAAVGRRRPSSKK